MSITKPDDLMQEVLELRELLADYSSQHDRLRQWALLFEQIDDAVVLTDPDGHIIDWNPAADRLFGFTPHASADAPPAPLEEPDPAAPTLPLPVLTQDANWVGRLPCTTTDGQAGVCEVRMTVVRDADSQSIGQVAVCRDVTAAVRAMEDLAADRQASQRMLASCPDPVIVLAADGTIRRTQGNVRAVAGLTGDPCAGLSIFSLLTVERGQRWRDRLDRARQTRSIVTDEDVIGEHWCETRFQPIEDQVAVWLRDVTPMRQEIHRRQRLDEQTLQRAREASMSALAAGVAQTVQQQLVGLIGHANLARWDLSSGSPALVQIDALEGIAQTLTDFAGALLQYAGKDQRPPEPTDVGQLLEELRPRIERLAPRAVVCEWKLTQDLPLILASAPEVTRAVLQLVHNSFEAMADRPGMLRVGASVVECIAEDLAGMVGASCATAGSFIELSVADTGGGLPTNLRSRLGEPFVTTKSGHRGMGLAGIVGMARKLRGGVDILSHPDQGTRVRLLLPIGSVGAPPSPAPKNEDWGQGVVLVVDQEPTVLNVTRRTLERVGFGVLTAADAEQGLHILRQHSVDIVLVISNEVSDPGLWRQWQPRLPLIWTCLETSDNIDGVVHLRKPWRPAELLRKVQETLWEART